MIWTDIEPLVDMGSSDLLSNTLDCPLTYTLGGKTDELASGFLNTDN